VRPEVVYRALPEAVTEVKPPVPVALILLLSNSHQAIGKYPDLPASAPPEDNHTGDIAGIILEPKRVVFQL